MKEAIFERQSERKPVRLLLTVSVYVFTEVQVDRPNDIARVPNWICIWAKFIDNLAASGPSSHAKPCASCRTMKSICRRFIDFFPKNGGQSILRRRDLWLNDVFGNSRTIHVRHFL